MDESLEKLRGIGDAKSKDDVGRGRREYLAFRVGGERVGSDDEVWMRFLVITLIFKKLCFLILHIFVNRQI